MKASLRGVALAALCASSLAAQAGVSSTAQASLVSYRLIDLAPGDGEAPSISFLPDVSLARTVSGSNRAAVYTPDGTPVFGPYGGYYQDATQYPATGPGQVSGALSTASSSASNGLQGAWGLSGAAEGQTSGYDARGLDLAQVWPYSSGFYSGQSIARLDFVLSAHTAAVFTFAGAVQTATDPVHNGRGEALVDLGVYLGDTNSTWASGQLDVPGSFSTRLGAYNTTGAVMSGTVSMNLSAFGMTYEAAPVPEAQTWGLALVGAVVVGVRSRRQVRQAQGASA